MFFRKIPLPLQEPLPTTAGATAPLRASRWRFPSPPDHNHLHRLVKIAVAVSVFGAGLAAMLSGHGKITSNNAVISTNLVALRAPIEGTVSSLPNRVGSMVAPGALIAHIENPRVSDEHLVDLREHQARVEAEIKASEANRATLLNLQGELVHRDVTHTR
jgi:multidrug efflux pump subunit AcrA (membrane-fusion protein)